MTRPKLLLLVRLAGVFLLALFLQAMHLEGYLLGGFQADWLMVLAWLLAYFYGWPLGPVVGLVCGLAKDAIFGQLIGLSCLIAFVTSIAAHRGLAAKESISEFFCLVQILWLRFLAVVIQMAVSILLRFWGNFSYSKFLRNCWYLLPRQIGLDILAGLILLLALKYIFRLVPVEEGWLGQPDYLDESGRVI